MALRYAWGRWLTVECWGASGRRPSSVVGTTRRGGMDRQAATLMYAGWDRRSAIRRKVPLTSVVSGETGGHSSDGDRSCDGGAPARRDDGGLLLGRSRVGGWHGGSGGHFGPQKPGQLPGDGGGDDVGRGLADAQTSEASAESELGRPGPSHHLRVQAVLSSGELGADAGMVLVGPGRLDQLGAQMQVAGPW